MNRKFIFLTIIGFVLVIGFTQLAFARWFTSKTVEFLRDVPTVTPLSTTHAWRWSEKLKEAEDILSKISLSVSSTERIYQESVFSAQSFPNRHLVTQHDRDREIALAVLEVKTGDIRTVIIQKKGADLIAPEDFPISIIERSNGIRWNKWNTQYQAPEGYVVIKNSYPDLTGITERKVLKDRRGRTYVTYVPKVEYFIYTPYSEAIHDPELVSLGREYLQDVVRQSFVQLDTYRIPSLAFQGQTIGEAGILKPEYFQLLPLIEQTDMTEFILDPQKTSERVLVLIGSNASHAFEKTGSPAGALGWVQYTKKTYDAIRRTYPKAGLIPDFTMGAADHKNSMLAAVLLYDYNLAHFIKKSGNQIIQDERLEEYLAAAYNGGPVRINQSLQASILARDRDWLGGLLNETQGYIVKLRALHSMDIMQIADRQ